MCIVRRTFLYSCTPPILSPTLAICRVKRVGPGALTVKRSGEEAESVLPFGTCVWATGIAMHPLVGFRGGKVGHGHLTSQAHAASHSFVSAHLALPVHVHVPVPLHRCIPLLAGRCGA